MEYNDDMSQVKKILIISYYFPPSNSVGAVRVGALYEFLIRHGYDVEIVCFEQNSKSIPSQKKGKKKALKKVKLSQYFRSIDKTVFSKFTLLNLKNMIYYRNKYDIIICSYKPIANILLGILLKILSNKTKLFIEFRDLISQFGRKKKAFFFHKSDELMDKFYCKFADELISVSPTSRSKAQKFYQRKVNLIYNGIDSRKDYYKEPSNKVKILYAGTLSEVRNLKLITNHIQKSERNVELIVASNQNPEDYNGNLEFVKHIGFISRTELEEIIKQVDFLLILEGFDKDSEENIPAKIFEYLSYNKPIMANCSPNSEIVKILDETESGKNINDFKDFDEYLKIKNYRVNKNIDLYTRENQFRKYLKLIDEHIKA